MTMAGGSIASDLGRCEGGKMQAERPRLLRDWVFCMCLLCRQAGRYVPYRTQFPLCGLPRLAPSYPHSAGGRFGKVSRSSRGSTWRLPSRDWVPGGACPRGSLLLVRSCGVALGLHRKLEHGKAHLAPARRSLPSETSKATSPKPQAPFLCSSRLVMPRRLCTRLIHIHAHQHSVASIRRLTTLYLDTKS